MRNSLLSLYRIWGYSKEKGFLAYSLPYLIVDNLEGMECEYFFF